MEVQPRPDFSPGEFRKWHLSAYIINTLSLVPLVWDHYVVSVMVSNCSQNGTDLSLVQPSLASLALRHHTLTLHESDFPTGCHQPRSIIVWRSFVLIWYNATTPSTGHHRHKHHSPPSLVFLSFFLVLKLANPHWNTYLGVPADPFKHGMPTLL